MRKSLERVLIYFPVMSMLFAALYSGQPGQFMDGALHAADEMPVLSSLMSRLETAENNRDIKTISGLFAEDAVIHVPDNMPFVGRESIISLYEFIWQRPVRYPTRYVVEGRRRAGDQFLEYGTSITRDQNGIERSTSFRALIAENDPVSGDLAPVIRELVFGEAEKAALSLPAPTGVFGVGRTVRYRTGEDQPDKRPLSVELWYPARSDTGDKATQHTRAVTQASATFLGLPPFMFSYSAVVVSNAVRNAPPGHRQALPVILYNHGYGGFTSVYQTIFEELASHGYVVASIGHVNESSLLLIDGDRIVASQPGNETYASRASELEGPEVNRLQGVILNSDNPVDLARAYRKLIQLSPLHNESTRLWASDTRHVLTFLRALNVSDPLLQGIFDLGNVGVMGHSVGGATAGQLAMGTDGVRAGINIDGFQFGDLVDNRLAIPFMFIVSNQHDSNHLRALSFMASSEADTYQAVLRGFSHDSFSDLDLFRKTDGHRVGGTESINLQRRLIRSFFDRYLKNKAVRLSALADDDDRISITSDLK